MQVLMLSKACIVGAYQRKLEELAARGVDLTVVVPRYWKDSRGVIPLEKKYLSGYRLIVAAMRFNGHFHIHYYPSLPQYLREMRPAIMHIDEEACDFVTYHAVRSAINVGARPLFFTWQNLLRRYPPPFSWFEQYNFRACQHAIAGNADAVNVLRVKGYAGEVRVIPQFGVDPDIFYPHPQPLPRHAKTVTGEGSGSPFTIAYVGRLVREKGIDILLRAVKGLSGDWQLRLLGAGPEQAKLKRLCERLSLGERVCFEPQVPSTQMAEFYAQSDLLVLPSRRVSHWTEQFGRVLIEAMACGVPVIGSDCGEIPNTIGDAGLIFPEGNVEALRTQIERVMSDGNLRAELSRRGRARVLAKFTQAQVAQQTVAVYQTMMKELRL